MDKMITDKMTINFDVFSSFMEDIIVSNMNNTLVVTIKKSSRGCRHIAKEAQMWYQQGHDILLQYWSGPHESVSYFTKKLEKNQEENNNQWWTYDQWDFLPNQHQKMH